MKVFFDIITNHTADVIHYDEGAAPAYVSKDREPYKDGLRHAVRRPRLRRRRARFPPLSASVCFPYHPFVPGRRADRQGPAWLNDVERYHNRGNTTFTGENSLYGDFFGLDDLFTEQPQVVSGMTEIYEKWIGDFSIDGFRIDTMKHVNDEFWQQFLPDVLDYAHAPGQARVLHVRRGVRHHAPVHVALHDDRPRRRPCSTSRSRRPPRASPPARARPTRCATSSRATTGTRTRTPTRTSCRRSWATTTWAASAASSSRPTAARPTPSCWPATGSRTS